MLMMKSSVKQGRRDDSPAIHLQKSKIINVMGEGIIPSSILEALSGKISVRTILLQPVNWQIGKFKSTSINNRDITKGDYLDEYLGWTQCGDHQQAIVGVAYVCFCEKMTKRKHRWKSRISRHYMNMRCHYCDVTHQIKRSSRLSNTIFIFFYI